MDILFNSRTPEFAWLSNFSPHPVGTQPTAEHAYQACKSSDKGTWDYIRQLPTPAAAKKWAKVTLDTILPPDWPETKLTVMRRVLRRKFTDHPELKWALIGTYPHPLYHLAPWDTFWGVDNKMDGANMMGEILMELRHELRN